MGCSWGRSRQPFFSTARDPHLFHRGALLDRNEPAHRNRHIDDVVLLEAVLEILDRTLHPRPARAGRYSADIISSASARERMLNRYRSRASSTGRIPCCAKVLANPASSTGPGNCGLVLSRPFIRVSTLRSRGPSGRIAGAIAPALRLDAAHAPPPRQLGSAAEPPPIPSSW